MQIASLPQIMAALDPDTAMAAVEEGFKLYSAGLVEVGAVAHLGFAGPQGECHVKTAHIAGDPVFVVKIATGFYANPAKGLSSSNGAMLLLSAETGEPLALLQDQGRLTDLRTAMAGAIAARLLCTPGPKVLGVLGSGIQARLQAQYLRRVLGVSEVVVWARNVTRAAEVAADLAGEGVAASIVGSVAEVCARADVIVSTTSATTPLVSLDMVRPGATFIAMGSDSPGKQELDARILARARHVVVDSIPQCSDHGEAGCAIRAGLLDPASLIELGAALADPGRVRRDPDEIVVADLTGVAVQDVQIAKAVWARL